jgi:hypothetical protein
MNYLKTFILSIIMTSCVQDDDNSNNNTNLNLLYGQWFELNTCQPQNNLTLNSNGNYTWIQSMNINCDNNEYSTRQFLGSYTVSGNDIDFDEESSETIELGDVSHDTVHFILLPSEIISITENNLTLEITYLGLEQGAPNFTEIFQFEK